MKPCDICAEGVAVAKITVTIEPLTSVAALGPRIAETMQGGKTGTRNLCRDCTELSLQAGEEVERDRMLGVVAADPPRAVGSGGLN